MGNRTIVAIFLAGGVVLGGWKYFHRSFPTPTEVVPTDPEDGYSAACKLVISAVKANGGTGGWLPLMTDESLSAWNQRLRAVCRPSVSIISAAVAKTYGYVTEDTHEPRPVLFGASPIGKERFRQWLTQHRPQYVNSEAGDPVIAPQPDTNDAEDLLAAETRLARLKQATVITREELDGLQLHFVPDDAKKRFLMDWAETDAEAIELTILIRARNAGSPIDDSSLTRWATNRVKEFTNIRGGIHAR